MASESRKKKFNVGPAMLIVLNALIHLCEAELQNVVVILVDDLGWNDVSLHGSTQIPTPNIDALASSGVILHNFYAQPMCTPSRAALMTGLYPFRTGMQNYVIRTGEPWGLPLEYKTLPEYLPKAYDKHILGKWHLGMFNAKFLPLSRGFDTFTGYLNGFIDYFSHVHLRPFSTNISGHDWHVDNTPVKEKGYVTRLLTEKVRTMIQRHDPKKQFFLYLAHLAPHTGCLTAPFQAPPETVAMFEHEIQDRTRALYAAMVTELDNSVGQVVAALAEKKILDKTTIIFMADNGGQTTGRMSNSAYNSPLRGQKQTIFEGGTRVVSFVWSPLIEKPARVEYGLMHMVDWLPTIMSLAGKKSTDLTHIDGRDQWPMISRGERSARREIVYNINYVDNSAAIRDERYKLIVGPRNLTEHMGSWYPCGGGRRPMNEVEDLMNYSNVADSLRRIKRWWKDQTRSPMEPEWAWRERVTVNCGAQVGTSCDATHSVCLFDLLNDPCEMTNIIAKKPKEAKRLVDRIKELSHVQHAVNNVPFDSNSVPKPDGFWEPWMR